MEGKGGMGEGGAVGGRVRVRVQVLWTPVFPSFFSSLRELHCYYIVILYTYRLKSVIKESL